MVVITPKVLRAAPQQVLHVLLAAEYRLLRSEHAADESGSKLSSSEIHERLQHKG